jgi:Tol biopolymer transport system component
VLNRNGSPVTEPVVVESANPVRFRIEAGSVTTVSFVLGVGDQAIAFGQGLVEVGIGVNDRTVGGAAVYLASGVLFRAPLDGSGRNIQLTPTNRQVSDDWAITKDGSRVVYRASSSGTIELYATNLNGSGTVKLNNALVTRGSVNGFVLTSNGTHVVYLADQDTVDTSELYASRLDGSGNVKLNGTLVTGGDVEDDFAVTPSGSHVVYRADQDTDNTRELYASRLDGSGNVKLNQPGGSVQSGLGLPIFSISPSGNRVVYLQSGTSGLELYASDLDGTNNAKLNGSLVAGGGVLGFISITPDGRHVVYVADQDTNNVLEIYASGLDGSGNVKLNGAYVAGGSYGGVYHVDNNRVVYTASQQSVGVTELFASNLDGSGNVKLNSRLVTGGDVTVARVSPDGTRVAYRANGETNGTFELYASNIDGSGNVKLSGAMIAGGNVSDEILFTPDGSRVLYRADQDTDNITELYASNIDGSGNVKLSGSFDGPTSPAGRFVLNDFALTPDGSRIVYRADQDTSRVTELYSSRLDASGNARLSLSLGGRVASFALTP